MLTYLIPKLNELLYVKNSIFYWKKTQGRRIAHKPAGWLSKGYVLIGICNEVHPAHRLLFSLHHNYCPEFIDHIDGNRANNKIENLRPATLNENARNCKKPSHNTSGFKGVGWDKNRNKWMAYITINNKFKSLGRYENINDANLAYITAAKFYFGNFARI